MSALEIASSTIHTQASTSNLRNTTDSSPSNPSAANTTGSSKPLRLPQPRKCTIPPDSGTWTRARLISERNAFWETRVTGQAQIWQVLRLVVDLIQKGELVEAKAVLEAAGCVCPTGAFWRGVYDERGESYEVPGWVIGEPEGLAVDDEELVDGDAETSRGSVEELVKEPVEYGEDGEMEKGKEREKDVGEVVKVKARLSDRATDVVVKVGMEEDVKILVRRVEEKASVCLIFPIKS